MLNKHIIMNGEYTWLFGEGKLKYVKQTYYNERWNTLYYFEKVS